MQQQAVSTSASFFDRFAAAVPAGCLSYGEVVQGGQGSSAGQGSYKDVLDEAGCAELVLCTHTHTCTCWVVWASKGCLLKSTRSRTCRADAVFLAHGQRVAIAGARATTAPAAAATATTESVAAAIAPTTIAMAETLLRRYWHAVDTLLAHTGETL